MIEFNTEGITATAAFLSNLHSGKFRELLPGIFIIKGAKNDRGFDQAYAVQNGKKDLILLDVVEVVYKKPPQYLRSNDYNIKAILTTGKGVKNNCYANSQTIAEDAGSADIHIHPDIAPQDQETKELIGKSELLDNFGLKAMEFPGKMAQSSSIRHNEIIFSGDSAVGSAYTSDEFLFIRVREQNDKEAFKVEEFWKGFNKKFDYFFPKGKTSPSYSAYLF